LSRLRLEELPYTSNNPAVQVFRHAIAIDEFRRMFRVQRWKEPQEFKPNCHSQAKSFPPQDIRQVWFAGCHSDVGGGFIEDQSALAKYPLRWMLEQAADKGLFIRKSMLNHIVLGKERKNARRYTVPSVKGMLHKSLSAIWRPLEFVPKSVRHRDWPKRYARLGFYIPCGEPRFIPPNSLIHTSVVDRMKQEISYRPVNLPSTYVVESVAGPLTGSKLS
jgi:hypothetical protein